MVTYRQLCASKTELEHLDLERASNEAQAYEKHHTLTQELLSQAQALTESEIEVEHLRHELVVVTENLSGVALEIQTLRREALAREQVIQDLREHPMGQKSCHGQVEALRTERREGGMRIPSQREFERCSFPPQREMERAVETPNPTPSPSPMSRPAPSPPASSPDDDDDDDHHHHDHDQDEVGTPVSPARHPKLTIDALEGKVAKQDATIAELEQAREKFRDYAQLYEQEISKRDQVITDLRQSGALSTSRGS